MNTLAKHQMINNWCTTRGCFWCGAPFAYRGVWSPTVEHFIPRKHGGRDNHSNIVVAHQWCNSNRGHRMPSEQDMRRFIGIKGKNGLGVLKKFGQYIEAQISKRPSIVTVEPK